VHRHDGQRAIGDGDRHAAALPAVRDQERSRQGTVTSGPAAINCGTACSSDYVINTTVTLTAAPNLGSLFTGWTRCDTVSGSTCTVRVTAARSVTASFLGLPLF
jgi:Divergent InlB B-repeat domain